MNGKIKLKPFKDVKILKPDGNYLKPEGEYVSLTNSRYWSKFIRDRLVSVLPDIKEKETQDKKKGE